MAAARSAGTNHAIAKCANGRAGRLTAHAFGAAAGYYRTTRPQPHLCICVFIAILLPEPATNIYACYVSFNKEAGFIAHLAIRPGTMVPGTMTTAAAAPQARAMSGQPQARINAAGARSSSAGVLNTRSSIGWSTAYGPASKPGGRYRKAR